MELTNANGDVLFSPYSHEEAASILWDETRPGGRLADHGFAAIAARIDGCTRHQHGFSLMLFGS